MKNDNCVDKEYEEANEQNITARRWGCIFCWLGRTISHNGLKRPCYPTHGRAIGGRNQHWKRRIGNTNWHQNSLDGAVYHDYRHETFAMPCLDPYQKWWFLVLVDSCTQYPSPLNWKFSTLENSRRFSKVFEEGCFPN